MLIKQYTWAFIKFFASTIVTTAVVLAGIEVVNAYKEIINTPVEFVQDPVTVWPA